MKLTYSALMLQWGRTFSSAESERPFCIANNGQQASMGPHFFKCGKGSNTTLVPAWTPCFNGAALFQVRKGRPIFSLLIIGNLLQWGRTFSSAESGSRRDVGAGWRRASMGPHFFKCGKPNITVRGGVHPARFNGAALFQVRKDPEKPPTKLQIPSFNGAALFQVRKGKPAETRRRTSRSFNGAALFQVRKVGNLLLWFSIWLLASMGPHFFKCGKVRVDEETLARLRKASMGPHFFKCGKSVVMIGTAKDDFMLQWGRTFSSAESDTSDSH